MKIKFVSAFLFVSLLFQVIPAFSADSHTPEPYKKEEFPGFMHDIHRAEIITLGAMPFITFNASLAYSFGKYVAHGFNADYFVNPFAKSDDSGFSTGEQLGIIFTSIGISFCIGITDFIVHAIKRNNMKKRSRIQGAGPVVVKPIKPEDNLPPKEPVNSEPIDLSSEADLTEDKAE